MTLSLPRQTSKFRERKFQSVRRASFDEGRVALECGVSAETAGAVFKEPLNLFKLISIPEIVVSLDALRLS
jgi:hypothetical protein